MNISKVTENKKLFEFVKFVIIGVVATVLHYGIYYGLQLINIQYNLAYTIGYFLSFIFNFFASNYFTFNTKPNVEKGFKFFTAHAFNYGLQIVLLNIFIKFGISNSIAPIFVFAICIPTNFVFVRFALKSKK